MTNKYALGILWLVTMAWGPPRAAAASGEEIHTTWEGLSVIVGQKVTVAMPDGARIQGRATAVEADALAVDIRKTSNRTAYPKGHFLVPRATLRVVEIDRPTKQWRIVCTAAAGALGLFFAAQAAGVKGGWKLRTGIYTGLAVATPAIGYVLGSAADRRTITYVIAP